MKSLAPALLLSAAMIAIALLAIIGVVPEEVAQFAPLALLAIFPGVWMRERRACNRVRRGDA